MPASTSPVPPLARPGLPVVLIAHCPSAPAQMLPAPLSTTWAWKRLASASAAQSRSAWTSAVVSPSRRAASAGWGVSSVGPRARAATSRASASLYAMAFSASASSTSGLASATSAGSTVRSNIDTDVAEGELARAGPDHHDVGRHHVVHGAQHELRLGRSRPWARRGRAGPRRPCRRRRAARRARRAAPRPPCRGCPPIIAERAEVALVRVARARREPGARPARLEQRAARLGRGLRRRARGRRSSTRPQRSSPSAVCSPTLWAMKVSVRVARTAAPRTHAGAAVESARHVDREHRGARSR